MKNIAIIVPTLCGGGAERVAGYLGVYLKEKYNIIFFLLDKEKIVYDYYGRIIELEHKSDYGRILELKEYKKKLSIYCSISFMEYANWLNILSREEDKIIISERNNIYSEYQLNKIDKMIVENGYEYADRIITISEGVKKGLYKYGKIDLDKMVTAYNFINKQEIRRKANEKMPDNINEFVSGSKYIVNIGRLVEQKNQSYLIEQFNIFRRKYPEYKLVILGDGKLRKFLENKIADLKLCDYVKIYSYIDNPFPVIRNAYISVLSSLYEGYGNVIVESMILGVPVISADCLYGPREIIAGNSNYETIKGNYEVFERGILYKAGKNNLADAMDYLANNREEYEYISNNSKLYMEYYEDNKDIDIWIEAIESEYVLKNDIYKKFWDKIKGANKIILFGAGNSAGEVRSILESVGIEIYCYTVSRLEDNKKEIRNKKIYEIKEIKKFAKDALVILAIGHEYRDEVLYNLNSNGINNIYWM